MRDNGLELRERGNGLVIEAGDGTKVKASTLARDLSKPKLEKRLGPFEASPEPDTNQSEAQLPERDPIRLRVTRPSFTPGTRPSSRPDGRPGQALAEAKRRRKDRLVEDAKKRRPPARAAIKADRWPADQEAAVCPGQRPCGPTWRRSTSSTTRSRQALYDSHSRPPWADWLKQEATHGNAEALTALRAREAAQGLKGNTIQGRGDPRPGHAPVIDNITKKGTIIFRAGLLGRSGRWRRLQVSARPTARACRKLCGWRWNATASASPSTALRVQGADHPGGR
jgi:hypothetical protein